MASKPAVVIDSGTGYTKLGFSGNPEPQWVIPTVFATAEGPSAMGVKKGIEDLNFYIGKEALAMSQSYKLNYPMRHGIVENWDLMERFWEQCFYKYLRAEPSDHYVMLSESPLNTPENREQTAEIMFETFSVPGLSIAVQAVLALIASWTSKKAEKAGVGQSLTGTVIDSGEGVTYVIPVVEGYVIGSAVKSMPLAGRDMNLFIQQCLRDRNEPVPSEDSLSTAQAIKEQHCYVCSDPAKEFARFDTDPKKFQTFSGRKARTGEAWSADVGYEQFLAPELFFRPEIFSSDYLFSLPTLVDRTIQSCPIDSRRGLYQNIVLSGGSMMFKNLDKRLEREVKDMVKSRFDQNINKLRNLNVTREGVSEVAVNVVSAKQQQYAVWFGGSSIANMPDFGRTCISKQEYDEVGPSVCRYSRVFSHM